MRKIVSMLLVAVMCCGLLVGCGEKNDTTKLPHNNKVSIADGQEEVVKADGLESADGFNYTRETVELESKEYDVIYQFNNIGEIAGVTYDSEEATLEDAQKFVDSVYGELELDTSTGKYGPGREKNYIIKADNKTWVVGCFTAENGKTRIIISRDMSLD